MEVTVIVIVIVAAIVACRLAVIFSSYFIFTYTALQYCCITFKLIPTVLSLVKMNLEMSETSASENLAGIISPF